MITVSKILNSVTVALTINRNVTRESNSVLNYLTFTQDTNPNL